LRRERLNVVIVVAVVVTMDARLLCATVAETSLMHIPSAR